MNPLPQDIGSLFEIFEEQAERLLEHWQTRPGREDDPQQAISAMRALRDVLRRIEARQAGERDAADTADGAPGPLVDFGLQLLEELGALAGACGAAPCAQAFEDLCLPLALWAARHGAEIHRLEPVVNALARAANQRRAPSEMRPLYAIASEIVDAVSPGLAEATGGRDGPWRLLLINRAIIATRTHEPSLMEPAYSAIVELLPDEAARFFEEGMQQMDRVGYPEAVREVMGRYHALFTERHTLH